MDYDRLHTLEQWGLIILILSASIALWHWIYEGAKWLYQNRPVSRKRYLNDALLCYMVGRREGDSVKSMSPEELKNRLKLINGEKYSSASFASIPQPRDPATGKFCKRER